MLVRWSAQESYTDWTFQGDGSTQAGFYRHVASLGSGRSSESDGSARSKCEVDGKMQIPGKSKFGVRGSWVQSSQL